MIVGSQEWSEVQPIDWRQITSLSLSLFVFPFDSLPPLQLFFPSFCLIWSNGNTWKRSLPCKTIGSTIRSVFEDAFLLRAGTNTCTQTLTHIQNVHSKTNSTPARTGTASDTPFATLKSSTVLPSRDLKTNNWTKISTN